MKLHFNQQGHTTVAELHGSFSAEAVAGFKRGVHDQIANRARDFVLQCAKLESIDSQGLEALLWLEDTAAEHLGQVRLIGCNDDLLAVLAATRLDARLTHHASIEQAMQSLEVAA